MKKRLIDLQPVSEKAALKTHSKHIKLLNQVLENLSKSFNFIKLDQTQISKSNDNILEIIVKVTDFDFKYIQMVIEDQTIFLRKEDCFLNAIQIIKLTKKDNNKHKNILDKMKKYTKVDIKKTDEKKIIYDFWINLQHGQILYNFLFLKRQLQSLLKYIQRLQNNNNIEMIILSDRNYLIKIKIHQLFIAIRVFSKFIIIRKLDFKINFF